MSGKLEIDDIKIGAVMETTFWANPVEADAIRRVATTMIFRLVVVIGHLRRRGDLHQVQAGPDQILRCGDRSR